MGLRRQTLRCFSKSIRSRRDEQHSDEAPITRPTGTLPTSTLPRPPPAATDGVKVAPAEDLPSHKENQKYAVTKRFNTFMDTFLARAAIAGHEINKYTGTDYTGIEALRQEIKDQEQLVKTRHASITEAKAAFDIAQTQQLASQKEVVSLLERKNSWSSGDLERYMSLIRSEHVNEQNVQAAREGLLAAERALEEARTRLEGRERAQYHEEQIWSDTIRRNSTWVTIGLMGFNIILLLANIGIFEPWRRRRIIREIKTTFDERGLVGGRRAGIEMAIDEVVEPDAPTPKEIEKAEKEEVMAVAASADDFVGGTVSAAPMLEEADEEMQAVEDQAHDVMYAKAAGPPSPISKSSSSPKKEQKSYNLSWSWQMSLPDLFSRRLISIRKVDMTMLALESVAIGAAAVGLLVAFFRPR